MDRRGSPLGKVPFTVAFVVVAAAVAGFSYGRASSPPDAQGIQGVWEVTSVRNLTRGEIQPHRREFHLFGKTHQMVVLAGEGRPKLTKSLSDMTPEEFLSQQPIGAGFYRYELENGIISRTNVAALSAYYEGRTFVGEVEIAGDTLALRDCHSADGHEREWNMRRVQ